MANKVRVYNIQVSETAVQALLASDGAQSDMDTRAARVEAMQHRLVPIDTGDLDSVIETRKTADGLGREIGVFEDNTKGVEYAPPVEFGWTHPVSGREVPAQPFIRPSLDGAR